MDLNDKIEIPQHEYIQMFGDAEAWRIFGSKILPMLEKVHPNYQGEPPTEEERAEIWMTYDHFLRDAAIKRFFGVEPAQFL